MLSYCGFAAPVRQLPPREAAQVEELPLPPRPGEDNPPPADALEVREVDALEGERLEAAGYEKVIELEDMLDEDDEPWRGGGEYVVDLHDASSRGILPPDLEWLYDVHARAISHEPERCLLWDGCVWFGERRDVSRRYPWTKFVKVPCKVTRLYWRWIAHPYWEYEDESVRILDGCRLPRRKARRWLKRWRWRRHYYLAASIEKLYRPIRRYVTVSHSVLVWKRGPSFARLRHVCRVVCRDAAMFDEQARRARALYGELKERFAGGTPGGWTVFQRSSLAALLRHDVDELEECVPVRFGVEIDVPRGVLKSLRM